MKAKTISTPRPISGIVAGAAVVFAILMAVGPGVLLVNRPTIFLGLPMVYTWGIAWYLFICVVAIVSYVWIWRGEDDGDLPREDDQA